MAVDVFVGELLNLMVDVLRRPVKPPWVEVDVELCCMELDLGAIVKHDRYFVHDPPLVPYYPNILRQIER